MVGTDGGYYDINLVDDPGVSRRRNSWDSCNGNYKWKGWWRMKASELIRDFQKSLEEAWGYIWGKSHEMWSKAKQEQYAKDYADDPDRALSVKYGGKWSGHWVTDCSGIFSYWFKQHGQEMYHGSNTMYKSWCTAKGQLKGGKRTDGQELKPGTAIFTGTENKHGHVGLYIGNGQIIEAKGAQYGVVTSPITQSRWTYWGELKGVEFDGQPTPEPGTDKPTLRKGDKGEWVTKLQTKLYQLGYNLGKYGIDGDFGSATETAVESFQRDNGLNADGVVGAKTWAALENSDPISLYTVWIEHLPYYKAEALVKAYDGCSYMRKEN